MNGLREWAEFGWDGRWCVDGVIQGCERDMVWDGGLRARCG